MMQHCHACGAPLVEDDLKGPSKIYCRGCCDARGRLRPHADIQSGIAQWFQSWQPGVNEATALKRAELYMRSMPAWADKE